MTKLSCHLGSSAFLTSEKLKNYYLNRFKIRSFASCCYQQFALMEGIILFIPKKLQKIFNLMGQFNISFKKSCQYDAKTVTDLILVNI